MVSQKIDSQINEFFDFTNNYVARESKNHIFKTVTLRTVI